MTTDHDKHADNLGAYALGALPELERSVLERHLMGCDACRAELARLGEAAAALPRSVPQLEPSPAVRERLMETVRREAAGARRARRPALPGLRRLALPRPALAAALAVAFALVAGAGFGIGTLTTGGEGERTVAARVDAARAPDASGSLVLHDGGDGAVLRLHGLAQLGDGRVYQLWLRRGSEIVPAGVFTPQLDGTARAALPDAVAEADAVMVTRERAGGATSPSERPIVVVELA